MRNQQTPLPLEFSLNQCNQPQRMHKQQDRRPHQWQLREERHQQVNLRLHSLLNKPHRMRLAPPISGVMEPKHVISGPTESGTGMTITAASGTRAPTLHTRTFHPVGQWNSTLKAIVVTTTTR